METQPETRELKIGFGGLAGTLSSQLKKQNFKFDKKTIAFFEKLRDSIIYLRFNSLITDKTAVIAESKLFMKIKQHIKKKNKN